MQMDKDLRITGAARLALLALLLCATGARAQEVTLVSNFGETSSGGINVLFGQNGLGAFRTGTAGATLSSIEIKLKNSSGTAAYPAPAMALYPGTVSGGQLTLGTKLADMTAPSTTSAAEEKTFLYTAPADTTLAAETTYYAVISAANVSSNLTAGRTNTDSVDAGGATGWDIVGSGFGTGTSYSFTTSSQLLLRVKGTLTAATTLSALALTNAADSTAVALNETFAAATTAYTANAGNAVSQITVAPTTTDAGASFDILDDTDTSIADADTTAAGRQVDLPVGAKEIRIKVTSADTTRTRTYTVTVTRAGTSSMSCAAPDLSGRNHVWTGTLTVGGAALGYLSGNYGALDPTQFTVGGNTYTIRRVTSGPPLRFNLVGAVQLTAQEKATLRLHSCGSHFDFADATFNIGLGAAYLWNNTGLSWSSGDTVLLHLSETRAVAPGAPQDFTATPGDGSVALAWDAPQSAGTADIEKYQYRQAAGAAASGTWTDVPDGDGDADLADERTFTVPGLTNGTQHTFEVRAVSSAGNGAAATARATPASTDATLSGLSLTNAADSTAVSLNEMFAAATTAYTADVGNAVSQITVAPTTTDAGATFDILDDTDASIADADTTAAGRQVDLAVGEKEIRIEVTASDTTTTQTYTVTVTRADAVCLAPDFGTRRSIWTGELTVGNRGDDFFGFLQDRTTQYGALDDTEFSIAGTAYTITEFMYGIPSVFRGKGLNFSLASELPAAHREALRLHVCDAVFDLSSAVHTSSETLGHRYTWENHGLDWTGATMRTVHLSLANNEPTGAPAVTGTAQVDQVLTAARGDFDDADGLPSTTFPAGYAFQWVRLDADGVSNPEDIDGANRLTYRLTPADLGKRIAVRVTFTDGLGTEESVLSAPHPATGQVAAAPERAPLGGFWSTTLTVGTKMGNDTTDGGGSPAGYCAGAGTNVCGYGRLTDDDFTLGGVTYTVESIRWSDSVHLTLDRDFPADVLPRVTLCIGAHCLVLADADRVPHGGNIVPNNYSWVYDGLELTESGDLRVMLSVTGASEATLRDLWLTNAADNTPLPLNETFDPATADYTASVANAVNRVTVGVLATDANATTALLDRFGRTLPDADSVKGGHQVDLALGANQIRVRVTAENGVATQTYGVTVTRAGASTMSCAAPDFGTRRHIWTGKVEVGTQLLATDPFSHGYSPDVTDPGSLDVTMFSIGGNSYTIDYLSALDTGRSSDGGDLWFSLASSRLTTAEEAALRLHVCDTAYDFGDATYTATDFIYKWALNLDWSMAETRTLHLSVANQSATGAPAVSGTPGVGQALTAGLGSLADADGLATTFPGDYDFRWVYVDGEVETPIDGADMQSYTPVLDDVDKMIAVRVFYTDGLGNPDTARSGPVTVPALPKITVEADRPSATGKIDWIHWTLTREGTTASPLTDALTVELILEPFAGNDWGIPASNLEIDVTFDANSATATVSRSLYVTTIPTSVTLGFSGSATKSGALSASIGDEAGFDTRDTDEVYVVVTPGAPWTVKLGETAYEFTEDGGKQNVEVVATAASVAMPKPSASASDDSVLDFSMHVLGDTADYPADFITLSSDREIPASKCTAEAGQAVVCRDNFGFEAVDDDLVESEETLTLRLVANPPFAGNAQIGVEGPDGTVDHLDKTYPASILDDDFGVLSVEVTSTPRVTRAGETDPDTYGEGETIEFTATFNRPVAVAPTPTAFAFDIGATPSETAAYAGAGGTAVTFEYTVLAADADTDGISWDAGTLGPATVFVPGDMRTPSVTPVLAYAAQSALAMHRVDGSESADPDTTAPTVTSIERQDPTSSPTNANTLKWRVTFDEDVKGVDAADFEVSGTSAPATVAAVTGSASQYDVTVTGGDLASLTATVTLAFATDQNIKDDADNELTATTPTGTNENTFDVDNTAPTVTISNVPATSTAAFTATFTFSEDVMGFEVGDITVGNGSKSTFTGSDGDTVYTALITPTADGAVTVDVAADVALDDAGNGNTAATQKTSTYTAPAVTCAAPTLTGRSQIWTGEVTVDDIIVLGTHFFDGFNSATSIGSLDETTFSVGTNNYTVDAVFVNAPGTTDAGRLLFSLTSALTEADQAQLTLHVCDESVAFSDATLSSTEFSYTWADASLDWSSVMSRTLYLSVPAVDTTAPRVTSIERQAPTSSPTNADTLKWRVTFSENVKDVDAADFTVTGTSAPATVAAVTGSSSQYDVTVTGGDLASLTATVTLAFAAGQNIKDVAENALANTTPTGTNHNTFDVDNTAPTVTISNVPATSTAAFTATFTFSEDVTGFALEDITVGNGSKSTFTGSDGDTVYTALITPTADGAVTVDVAADVALDDAGNGNAAAAQTTSTYTAPVCAAPNLTGQRQIWTGTVMVGAFEQLGVVTAHGFISPSSVGSLDDTTFTVGTNNYTVDAVAVSAPSTSTEGRLQFRLTSALAAADLAQLTLHVCGDAFALADRVANLAHTYSWADAGLDWSSVTSRMLYLSVPNAEPTGAPTISGTAQVGQTLTADTSGIADADGLTTPNYTYQWIRVNGTDADIEDAESSAYTPVAADVGKTLKVRVSFTDDAGKTHTLTSAETATVTAAPAVDTTAPRVTSIERQAPTSSPTNADTLKWRVTFSENVKDVDAADFTVTGTSAPATVAAVTGSSSQYDVTVTGGDLASLTATVTLAFAAGQNIKDVAENALANTTPTGTNHNTFDVDNTAPTVTITNVPATSTAAFTATFTFSEDVMGFEVGDITVGNGERSAFTGSDGDTEYTALITPTADGAVTVDVAADVALDDAGNGNTAAARVSSNYTASPVAGCKAPNFGGRRVVWSATVTVGAETDNVFGAVLSRGYIRGSDSPFGGREGTGGLDNDTLTVGGNTHTVTALKVAAVPDTEPSIRASDIAGDLIFSVGNLFTNASGETETFTNDTRTALKNLRLHVCDGRYDFSAGTGPAAREPGGRWEWPASLDWSGVSTRRVHLSLPATSELQMAGAEAAQVEGTLQISGAGGDGEWSEGETVDVRLTLNRAVDVDIDGGTPSIEIPLGGSAKRQAAYASGSGTEELVFVHTLVEGEADGVAGETLDFTVTLSRALAGTVTVDYATSDGAATVGPDYTAASGTLVFAAGETSKTVAVPVLDDAHDEGTETLTVTLSNARVASLDRSTATGTIRDTDPMPRAWLARFGRASSDHAIDAISSRWQGGAAQAPESHLTLGGRRVDGLIGQWRALGERLAGASPAGARAVSEPGEAWTRMDRLRQQSLQAGAAPGGAGVPGGVQAPGGPGSQIGGATIGRAPGAAPGSPGPSGDPGRGRSSRQLLSSGLAMAGLPGAELLASGTPRLRDLLMGGSFFYSAQPGRDGPGRLGQWSAWGRTAATRFSGAQDALSVEGEVATATLGLDSRWGRWHGGVALAYSEGDGGYTARAGGASGGEILSTLTSLHPFARYQFSDRTSVWGVVGYGAGALRLDPDGAAAALDTDLATKMAAFGGRTVVSRPGGGFELSMISDARMSVTESESVTGLMGAAGAANRVRLMLEGAGSLTLASGGVLTPRLEAGLRYDGGDAETGAGLELGASLDYALGRVTVQLGARALVAHEDTEYEEWGASGSIAYRPRADGLGLSVKLGSAWGQTQSGVQSLWAQPGVAGLARGAFNAAQRFETELGYGVQSRDGGAQWHPYVGAHTGHGRQAVRMGLKFASGAHREAALELLREQAGHEAPAVGVRLTGSVRF